jgi:hypothetical protein
MTRDTRSANVATMSWIASFLCGGSKHNEEVWQPNFGEIPPRASVIRAIRVGVKARQRQAAKEQTLLTLRSYPMGLANAVEACIRETSIQH